MSQDNLFPHIALLGLGLIGSSLAHMIKRNFPSSHISGFAPSQKTRDYAQKHFSGTTIYDNAPQAVEGADLVLLCAPPHAFGKLACSIQSHLKQGAIISDVGSFKQKAILDIEPHLPSYVYFIPAHPIAGTEKSGPDSGFASLFENRWCILTPLENKKNDPAYQIALGKMQSFWRKAGSKIALMDESHHDKVLALTSHLPHVIAWTIVLSSQNIAQISRKEVVDYSGGGFRDFTRLAASDPIMWRDVLIGNRQAVLEMIDHFADELQKIRKAIDDEQGDFLKTLFAQTKSIRDKIIEAGQDK